MANGQTGVRKRQWEEEMLAEWLAAKHPRARVLYRVRLGPLASAHPDATLTDAERRLLGAAFRRWADAMIVEEGTLTVIEAALIPSPGDLAMLELYLHLVDATPELEEVRQLPRQGLLLWAVDDPYARPLAVRRGLRVEIYKPSHFTEWAEFQNARKTRPPRSFEPVGGGS